MKTTTTRALETLRSQTFFDLLRGAFRNLGLGGDEALALGIYFVATSALQPYPLRLEFQEGTEGTLNYVLRRVEKILLPSSLITIDAARLEDWTKLTTASHNSTIVIPGWRAESSDGYTRLGVVPDGIVHTVGHPDEERIREDSEKVAGDFALISADQYPAWPRPARWVTMRQQESKAQANTGGHVLRPDDIETWHEVQRLLQDRAKLPILLPSWEQIVVEEMIDDEKAARQIPTMLQCWRTMCLLRSFQSKPEGTPKELHAGFLDFAAAILLSKRLFREAKWFASPKKLFTRISPFGEKTGLLHPVTGKGVNYSHLEKAPLRWQSLLPEYGVNE